MSIIENDILNPVSDNYDPLRAIKEGIVIHKEPSHVTPIQYSGGICGAYNHTNTICGSIVSRNEFSCS